MKKLLMAVCFVVSMVSLSKAQGGGGGGRGMNRSPEDQLKNIQAAVPTLSADQSAKILAVYKSQKTSMDSLMTAGGDRQAMRPIMMGYRTRVMSILTEDQKAVYTKYMADMRAKMQNGGGMGGGGGTPPPPSEK